MKLNVLLLPCVLLAATATALAAEPAAPAAPAKAASAAAGDATAQTEDDVHVGVRKQ